MPAPRRWIRVDVGWSRSEWLAALEPAARLAWIELLTYAKTDGTAGIVRALAPLVFGRMFAIDVADVIALLEAATAGDDPALTFEDGTWTVTKWPDYQETDPTAADRMRRHRADRSRLSATVQNRPNGVSDCSDGRKPVTPVTRNNRNAPVTGGVTRHATVTVTETYTETEKNTTTDARDADDVENFVSSAIVTANIGMKESLRDAFQPILTSHASRQYVFDWLAAGISRDMITATITVAAKKAGKQISSMRYFDQPIREAHDRARSVIHPDSQAGAVKARGPSAESPKSQTKRSGKLKQAGSDEEVLSRQQDEQRRVDTWKLEQPADAARIWTEIRDELHAKGMDALGQRHFTNAVEAHFRQRIIAEHLTPKLAAS